MEQISSLSTTILSPNLPHTQLSLLNESWVCGRLGLCLYAEILFLLKAECVVGWDKDSLHSYVQTPAANESWVCSRLGHVS